MIDHYQVNVLLTRRIQRKANDLKNILSYALNKYMQVNTLLTYIWQYQLRIIYVMSTKAFNNNKISDKQDTAGEGVSFFGKFQIMSGGTCFLQQAYF